MFCQRLAELIGLTKENLRCCTAMGGCGQPGNHSKKGRDMCQRATISSHISHDGVDVMTVHTKHNGLRRFCWMSITAAMLHNTAAMSAEKATAGMAPVTAGCAALLGCVAQTHNAIAQTTILMTERRGTVLACSFTVAEQNCCMVPQSPGCAALGASTTLLEWRCNLRPISFTVAEKSCAALFCMAAHSQAVHHLGKSIAR
jgi:hypothetical protein